MVKRMCVVSNCKNGQAYTVWNNNMFGIKNKSIFKAPKERDMLHQWTLILKNLRKPLTENCFVCEDHFNEDDIIRFDECKLKDGTMYRSRRVRPKLKETAIPVATKNLNNYVQLSTSNNNTCSIDPHLDESINSQSSTTINDMCTQFTSNNSTCSIDPHLDKPISSQASTTTNDMCTQFTSNNSTCSIDPHLDKPISSQASTTINDMCTQFDFDILLSTYSHVQLPSCEWAVTASKSGKFVTFLTFSNNILRRVQINNNMTVQIFLNNYPLIVKRLPRSINCANDITNLMKFIDDMKICDNFKEAIRYKGCDGFLYETVSEPTCKKCIIHKNRDRKKQELLKCKKKKDSQKCIESNQN